jgi:hypothetical protein
MFVIPFIVTDVELIATVITLEENNTQGMYAISEVIYNRANKNPKNIRKVLLKRWHFTCLNPHTVKKEPLRKLVMKAKSRSNWNLSLVIAKNIKSGKVSNLVGESKHYHVYRGKIKCSPSWTHPSLGGKNYKCKIVRYIGTHVYLSGVD